MARARFVPNLAGYAALRNHPSLVRAMQNSAENAAASTPFDVEVVVWPHRGRRSGPRTSVQIWASSGQAQAAVNRDPSSLTSVLNQVNL